MKEFITKTVSMFNQFCPIQRATQEMRGEPQAYHPLLWLCTKDFVNTIITAF